MLTPTQRATLKTHIQNTPALNAYVADQVWTEIANLLNLVAAPEFKVWRSWSEKSQIAGKVIWARFTPGQAIPTTGTDTILVWLCKNAQAQAKMLTLQGMLLGGSTQVETALAGLRAGLEDCMTALPTKNDGTNQPAGWSDVQLIIQRTATELEKLFATGTGSTVSPAELAIGSTGYVEGQIGWDEIQLTMSE